MDRTSYLQGPFRRNTMATADTKHQERLAEPLSLEREWHPDRQAMLAALRVVLSLPPRPVSFAEEASS